MKVKCLEEESSTGLFMTFCELSAHRHKVDTEQPVCDTGRVFGFLIPSNEIYEQEMQIWSPPFSWKDNQN